MNRLDALVADGVPGFGEPHMPRASDSRVPAAKDALIKIRKMCPGEHRACVATDLEARRKNLIEECNQSGAGLPHFEFAAGRLFLRAGHAYPSLV